MAFDGRLQVLLDEERYDRIVSMARERGVSVATVVREAIDRGVVRPEQKRSDAGRRILAATDMEVRDVPGLKAELDESRRRHG